MDRVREVADTRIGTDAGHTQWPEGVGDDQGVGAFRFWFVGQRWEWSDGVARMHGYEPGTVEPTTELLLSHKHPDDRRHVQDLLDRALLSEKLGTLRELLPKEVLAQWQAWARDGMLPPLLSDLLNRHYDPLYKRSQSRDLRALPDATVVAADDLSAAGIEDLARRILAATA